MKRRGTFGKLLRNTKSWKEEALLNKISQIMERRGFFFCDYCAEIGFFIVFC